MTILSYCICSKTVGRDAKLYKHNIYNKTRQSVRISSFDSTTFLLILDIKSYIFEHVIKVATLLMSYFSPSSNIRQPSVFSATHAFLVTRLAFLKVSDPTWLSVACV